MTSACAPSAALLCARHLMSWHPRVERARREVPWLYLKRATDPLLGAQPFRCVRRSLHKNLAGI
jgi:hypothetical protein